VSDIQDMLFGTTSTAIIGDDVADRQLRLCALNLQGPAPSRAARLVEWLVDTQCNTMVLTEIHASDGGRQVIAGLRASGFAVTCRPGWQEARHFTAIATKGFTVVALPPSFDPRVVAVDLRSAAGTTRVAGIYGPTNGMTAESSARRSQFQSECLTYLRDICAARMCVAGDLNVIEPDHHPKLPDFAPHDYDFYTGLLALGLTDAYRQRHPNGGDHSWTNSRYGGQRLDHTLIGPTAGRVTSCGYDHTTRTTSLSDHSALITLVDLPADNEASTGESH
jgi:exonuclease III